MQDRRAKVLERAARLPTLPPQVGQRRVALPQLVRRRARQPRLQRSQRLQAVTSPPAAAAPTVTSRDQS
eukprot:222766-Prymnesium_polylepis.1